MRHATTIFVATLTVLLTGTARADVVHLTNGRFIEGKVIEERRGAVHIEVHGGRIVLPAASIDRIDRRETPQEEYAARARTTNMNDAEAVEQLALWASGRGLGEQAQHLRALAKGLHLERRVANSARGDDVQGWIDTFHWSRGQELSSEVQRWLVEQAADIDPDHPAVRAALRLLEEDRALALEAASPRPRVAPAKDGEAERVQELERELAQRELEDRAMRERLEQLEQQQQRRRPRRRRGTPVVLPTPCPPSAPVAEVQRHLLPAR